MRLKSYDKLKLPSLKVILWVNVLQKLSLKLLFNEINKGGSYEKRLETHGKIHG